MKQKQELKDGILSYDVNSIHEACESLGFSTSWESFEDELESYDVDDMRQLLQELLAQERGCSDD